MLRECLARVCKKRKRSYFFEGILIMIVIVVNNNYHGSKDAKLGSHYTTRKLHTVKMRV